MKSLIVASIVFGLLVGLWIIGKLTHSFQFLRATSSANQPTLKKGQFFFTTNLKKPRRFNFICYRVVTPEKGPAIRIHRLCGIPGDIIEIKAGILYVNKQDADDSLALIHYYKIHTSDAALVEYDPHTAYSIPPYSDILYIPLEDRYVNNDAIRCERYILPPGLRDEDIYRVFRQNWNPDNFGPIKVPAGKYFVLGDYRGNTLDSRYHGFVDQGQYLSTILWK